jgi:hypothetical protein
LTVNMAGPDLASQAARYRDACWMTAGDTDYR